MVRVRVKCADTRFGECVAVAGSWNGWDKTHCVQLQTSRDAFPIWRGEVQVTEGVEYKYVVIRDGSIVRWEPVKGNRWMEGENVDDIFGKVGEKDKANWKTRMQVSETKVQLQMPQGLDALEKELVKMTREQGSWRQRLSFIRELFVQCPFYFEANNLNHLATIAIYLNFLSTGQVQCWEDGGHYRPNHHANAAREIEQGIMQSLGNDDYLAHVARRIFPHLPSYSAVFTVNVPLTRIRDIAHRSDIPHDLKQEIKHTLQNKLHRCAGPEDLITCERLLNRVEGGGYSQAFVNELRIFHGELKHFFNATSLDDKLSDLQNVHDLKHMAHELHQMKRERHGAMPQMQKLTKLRQSISRLDWAALQPEQTQKIRLADIELEDYAFMLLAGVANDLEKQSVQSFDWNTALYALAMTIHNITLCGISASETRAISNELYATRQISDKLRIKAVIDRCRRFTSHFSDALTEVYSSRVVSLGNALDVDSRAIQVYAEAEIRANLTFQASRIADRCATNCRRELNLPAWDVVNAGVARGKVVRKERLEEVGGGEDVIAVCKWAGGDEEVPRNVRGVVLGRTVPLLSHLGVRARGSGVVFVCAEEREVFEQIWKTKEGFMEMVVDGAVGLKEFRRAENVEMEREEGKSVKKVEVKFDGGVRRVLGMNEVTKLNAGGKCYFAGRLHEMAKNSEGVFQAPEGLAIPHGVFQAEVEKWSEQYWKLVAEYEGADEKGRDECARALYEFVERNFDLDDEMCEDLRQLEGRVMVRSSANAEDLEDMSGAGLYDSIANVRVESREELKVAVKKVWASLWTKRAAASRQAYGVEHGKVSMAVLVQRMIKPDYSFIAFSRDPGGGEYVYVEVAVGLGETLASGGQEGCPYRFRVCRKSEEVVSVAMANFAKALVPRDEDVTEVVVDYSKERMTRDVEFRERVVKGIARVVRELEVLGGGQDVEGVVVGERITVVQARPQIL